MARSNAWRNPAEVQGQIALLIPNPALTDEHASPEHPICPVCRRQPVRVTHTRDRSAIVTGPYCGGRSCISPTRLCHHCDQPYTRGTPGAGTKYCSDECKASGYARGTAGTISRAITVCAVCEGPYRARIGARHQVCSRCAKRFAGQIQTHRLDTAWAKRLITATHCDACQERLPTGSGKHLGQIDHDHGCCPGGNSCGRCVRGILCNRCNTIAAAIENDPHRHQAVRDYLTRP